jgi:hypothetical protein
MRPTLLFYSVCSARRFCVGWIVCASVGIVAVIARLGLIEMQLLYQIFLVVIIVFKILWSRFRKFYCQQFGWKILGNINNIVMFASYCWISKGMLRVFGCWQMYLFHLWFIPVIYSFSIFAQVNITNLTSWLVKFDVLSCYILHVNITKPKFAKWRLAVLWKLL